MQQRFLTNLSLLVGGTFAALAAMALEAQAQTVLRMNNWLPAQHSQLVGTMKPWAEAVEKATNGRVKIELTAASLGAPPRQYDLAVDGIADITFGVHGYTPGRFKLTAVAELPFMGDSGEALSVALWRVHEKFFKKANEHKGVVLLGIYAHRPGTIMTASAPIASLADYKGRKIRVGGGIVQQINPALGGVNVAASANEVYELLSQGVVDGTLLPSEAYSSFKLEGVIKYETTIPGGLYSSTWFAVMNRDAFDKLSPEDQKALMSVSGENLARLGGRTFDEADKAAIKVMEEKGVKRITADAAFVKDIQDKLAFLNDTWIKDAEKLKVDGKAALQMMREEAKAYKPSN